MYLTRAEVAFASRLGADCLRDTQKIHAIVTGLTGGKQSDSHTVYRARVLQNRIVIYCYSDNGAVNEVPFVNVTGNRDVTAWLESLTNGMTLGFNLVAAPSKKVKTDGKKNSQRRLLRNKDDRLDWLNRKAMQNGFKIIEVQEQKEVRSTIRHPASKGGMMHINAFEYQGTLTVTDEELFKKAIKTGIGSGKAYGFGMILIK